MSTRRLILSLYRQLLREAGKLPSYNFRMYAVRKIKDTYRANKTVQDFNEIDALAAKAKDNLELIRRQVIIGHMYSADKLVIETKHKTLNTLDD